MKFQKQLTKKVKSIIQSDMLVSIAIVSICANILFFVAIAVYTTTTKLDESTYSVAYKNLCVDEYKTNLKKVQKDAANPVLAGLYFDITCGTGEFAPYHENAIEEFINDNL